MSIYEACGPNVEQIIKHGSRVIRGRIPASVRKELRIAVKLGQLCHLNREGLLPEIYFHPNNKTSAMEIRKREANYSIGCIAQVMVSGNELIEEKLRGILA